MVSRYINNTERKYLSLVKSSCAGYFIHSGPYSHGPDHHLRVWLFACDILLALEKSGISVTAGRVEALFFACWFHDTGLTIDKSEIHGIHSRDIFTDFIKNENITIPHLNEVLYAIEFHDRKENEYTGNPHDIHTVLSVADDLDSFGITGLYRYMDIYARRSVPPGEMEEKIKKNMSARFANFSAMYDHLPLLQVKHRARFENAISFIERLEWKGSQSSAGGIISLIESAGDIPVTDLINITIESDSDGLIRDFFNSIRTELSTVPEML